MLRKLFVLAAWVCMIGPALWAQEARLSGTIIDPTGAVIPGVTISVNQTQQNISFTGKSNSVGQYLFPAIADWFLRSKGGGSGL